MFSLETAQQPFGAKKSCFIVFKAATATETDLEDVFESLLPGAAQPPCNL